MSELSAEGFEAATVVEGQAHPGGGSGRLLCSLAGVMLGLLSAGAKVSGQVLHSAKQPQGRSFRQASRP